MIFWELRKKRETFSYYINKEIKMKIVLFFLVMTVITVCGCAGIPSGSSGQIKPSFDGFTPEEYQSTIVDEYDSKVVQPTYNRDGSITVMAAGDRNLTG